MTDWESLPASVRDEIQQRLGPVDSCMGVDGGLNNDIALIITESDGHRAFLKGVHGVTRRMRMLRNEIRSHDLAPGIAPPVLFGADVDDWLIVGFEHVAGRPANFAPGSPDLPLVAETVEKIAALPASGLRSIRDRWSVDWWAKLADEYPTAIAGWDMTEVFPWSSAAPELADGDRLAHTDLHPDQFVIGNIGNTGVHVIDWGFPAAAAPWMDAAYMVLRLVDAGSTPADAEAWAWSLSCCAGLNDAALTAFAVYVAGMWTYWAVTDDRPGKQHRARLARRYASWRLHKVGAEIGLSI